MGDNQRRDLDLYILGGIISFSSNLRWWVFDSNNLENFDTQARRKSREYMPSLTEYE